MNPNSILFSPTVSQSHWYCPATLLECCCLIHYPNTSSSHGAQHQTLCNFLLLVCLTPITPMSDLLMGAGSLRLWRAGID